MTGRVYTEMHLVNSQQGSRIREVMKEYESVWFRYSEILEEAMLEDRVVTSQGENTLILFPGVRICFHSWVYVLGSASEDSTNHGLNQ